GRWDCDRLRPRARPRAASAPHRRVRGGRRAAAARPAGRAGAGRHPDGARGPRSAGAQRRERPRHLLHRHGPPTARRRGRRARRDRLRALRHHIPDPAAQPPGQPRRDRRDGRRLGRRGHRDGVLPGRRPRPVLVRAAGRARHRRAAAARRLGGPGAGRPGPAGAVAPRFVLVGIPLAAALPALISCLLTRLSLHSAGDAMHWMIGSLSSSTWDRAAVLAAALLVLIPALALLVVRLRILQLGDDTATSLGLSVPRTRVALILVAVALSALTVAVTGPLSFVAFLAGPLARMIAGRPSFPLAAVIGAVIVLVADIAGQNLFGTTELPAGVITGALGAPFLLWMLTRTPSSAPGR